MSCWRARKTDGIRVRKILPEGGGMFVREHERGGGSGQHWQRVAWGSGGLGLLPAFTRNPIPAPPQPRNPVLLPRNPIPDRKTPSPSPGALSTAPGELLPSGRGRSTTGRELFPAGRELLPEPGERSPAPGALLTTRRERPTAGRGLLTAGGEDRAMGPNGDRATEMSGMGKGRITNGSAPRFPASCPAQHRCHRARDQRAQQRPERDDLVRLAQVVACAEQFDVVHSNG